MAQRYLLLVRALTGSVSSNILLYYAVMVFRYLRRSIYVSIPDSRKTLIDRTLPYCPWIGLRVELMIQVSSTRFTDLSWSVSNSTTIEDTNKETADSYGLVDALLHRAWH